MPATVRKQQDGLLLQSAENSNPAEQPQFQVAQFLGEKQRALLRKGMCANLTDDQAEYFFERCERTQLDPFENQIWPSIRQTKDEHGQRHPHMFILVQLQGFRAIGDRSGLCDGEDPVEWCAEDGVWKPEWLLKEPPLAARARVYRKDRSRPQLAVCRWDAYCQFVWDKNGREIPNAIWKRLGSHMLGKCALAGCYRGLFPRQASGVYISEELGDGEGADTESEAAVEAEMTRKYAASKEYWDNERAKGHYPVGQKPPETATVEEPPSIASSQSAAAEPAKIVPEPEPAGDPRADWHTFPITRIRIFEGRTVGSLNESELRGLIPWLEKLKQRWGAADKDVRAHYTAIVQRIEHERAEAKAQQTLEDELQAELDYALGQKQP